MSGPPESPPQVSENSPPAHTIEAGLKGLPQAWPQAASVIIGTSARMSWSSDWSPVCVTPHPRIVARTPGAQNSVSRGAAGMTARGSCGAPGAGRRSSATS